jgi:NADH dehydrogenase (ubiquinone) 1 alpha subcomplex subunit 11
MSLQSFKTAQYYAKPDGEDYHGKMLATNRYALAVSVPLAYLDIIMFTKPKGTFPSIARFFYWTGPALATASAFTTTTYLAARMRGKDD